MVVQELERRDRIPYWKWHPFTPHTYSGLQEEKSEISFLQVQDINSFPMWYLQHIPRFFPNLETLCFISFHSDNREKILGQPLWNWLNTLPNLQALSVVIRQPEVRAVKTLEEVLDKTSPRIRQIRVALLEGLIFELREYTKLPDSQCFEVTFEMTYTPARGRTYPPQPNYRDFCFFKADIYGGHFV